MRCPNKAHLKAINHPTIWCDEAADVAASEQPSEHPVVQATEQPMKHLRELLMQQPIEQLMGS
jgi:hypothetical protein